MTAPRLPLRARALVAAVAVLGVLAVGGGTAAIRLGADALGLGSGFTVTGAWSPEPRWAGVELENRSALPVTLRAVDVRGASNARILAVRVIRPEDSHLLQLSTSTLTPDVRAAIAAGAPVDGFVLPPHSTDRYQLAVEYEPVSTGQASISRVTVVHSVLGLDHGAVAQGVYCVRAPGKGSCPPFG